MYPAVLLDDFSRGLDLVSGLESIAPGFTSNARNFRVSEYGGIEKTLGYSAFATLGAAAHDLFYFEKADESSQRIVAAEDGAWQVVTNAASVSNIRTSMTTVADTTFVSVDDVLYGLDDANIMASWDGTTLNTHAAGVDTGPPLGEILGVWNHRMYVRTAADPMTVRWSEPGNYTTTGAWPTANTVTLAGPTSADGIIGGMPTANGLVVFTRRATFLIFDTASGANRLVDPTRGLSSRRSLVQVGEYLYGLSEDGVFRTNGSLPTEIVSEAVSPLFREGSAKFGTAASVRLDRSIIVSYDRDGDDANELALEVGTRDQAIMALDIPMHAACLASFGARDKAYFVDASDQTKLRLAFDGGSAAGSTITAWYDLPPIGFADERQLKRLHRVRVLGRGANLQVGVREDFSSALALQLGANFPDGGGGTWGTSTWGNFDWGGNGLAEGWVRLRSRARRHALRIYESSTDTLDTRQVLGADGEDIGGCGVYLLEPHFAVSSRHR